MLRLFWIVLFVGLAACSNDDIADTQVEKTIDPVTVESLQALRTRLTEIGQQMPLSENHLDYLNTLENQLNEQWNTASGELKSGIEDAALHVSQLQKRQRYIQNYQAQRCPQSEQACIDKLIEEAIHAYHIPGEPIAIRKATLGDF